MSDDFASAMMALISLCAVAAIIFTRSIHQSTRKSFLVKLRDMLADSDDDEKVWAFFYLFRELSFWPRLLAIGLGWAITLMAFFLGNTTLFPFDTEQNKTISQFCHVIIAIVAVVAPILTVSLYLHRRNDHSGFS